MWRVYIHTFVGFISFILVGTALPTLDFGRATLWAVIGASNFLLALEILTHLD